MIRVLSREQPIILIALGARFHSRLFSFVNHHPMPRLCDHGAAGLIEKIVTLQAGRAPKPGGRPVFFLL